MEMERGQQVTLSLPPARLMPLDIVSIAELEAILGVPVDRDAPPTIVNVGAVWVVARVASARLLLSLQPDFARSAAFERRLGVTGLTIFNLRPAGRRRS